MAPSRSGTGLALSSSSSLEKVTLRPRIRPMKPTQILVVEDERIVAKDIQYMLRTLGYDVPVTVATGVDAIRTAEENHPDLVLMDINLRGTMDGVEAAEKIYAS